MESNELIGYFVAKAAELQKPVFLAHHGDGPPGVGATETPVHKAGVARRSSAGSAARESPLGSIKLRILCFDGENTRRNDDGDPGQENSRSQLKSIRFTILQGTNLKCIQTFVKASVVANKESTPRPAFTTSTVKAVDSCPVFEEGFTVHDSTSEMALHLRVCAPGTQKTRCSIRGVPGLPTHHLTPTHTHTRTHAHTHIRSC